MAPKKSQKSKARSRGAEARWEKNSSEDLGPARKRTETRWASSDSDERRPNPKVRKGAEARWEQEQD